MLYSIKSSKMRKIDDSLSIVDLFSKKEVNFDLVIAQINGNHPKIKNFVSQRVYFILEGSATVKVEKNEFVVNKNDLVFIEKGQTHTIKGNAKYLIITTPPFEPQNEHIVEE